MKRDLPPAYVSIRQHTSAYVSMRQRSVAVKRDLPPSLRQMHQYLYFLYYLMCHYSYFCSSKCVSICTCVQAGGKLACASTQVQMLTHLLGQASSPPASIQVQMLTHVQVKASGKPATCSATPSAANRCVHPEKHFVPKYLLY